LELFVTEYHPGMKLTKEGDGTLMSLLFLFLAYSTKLNKFPVFNINDDLNGLCTSAVSPNTTKATRYALNVWRYWCMTNGLKDHTDITKVRDA
jgi:hypothetical protein